MKKLLHFFEKLNFQVSELITENEGKEYKAAQFKINNKQVLFRKAKQTPKKVGQFVTCWKRNEDGITAPFHDQDKVDFYFIFVKMRSQEGLFIFPKSELIKEGIMASSNKSGKRGFRVYSTWDIPTSKQAIRAQQWQIKFFSDITDIDRIHKLIKE